MWIINIDNPIIFTIIPFVLFSTFMTGLVRINQEIQHWGGGGESTLVLDLDLETQHFVKVTIKSIKQNKNQNSSSICSQKHWHNSLKKQ